MADLQQFESELRGEHDRLTQRFNETQESAEALWSEHEQASRELTEFRSKYGKVLKALNESVITVTEEATEGDDAGTSDSRA